MMKKKLLPLILISSLLWIGCSNKPVESIPYPETSSNFSQEYTVPGTDEEESQTEVSESETVAANNAALKRQRLKKIRLMQYSNEDISPNAAVLKLYDHAVIFNDATGFYWMDDQGNKKRIFQYDSSRMITPMRIRLSDSAVFILYDTWEEEYVLYWFRQDQCQEILRVSAICCPDVISAGEDLIIQYQTDQEAFILLYDADCLKTETLVRSSVKASRVSNEEVSSSMLLKWKYTYSGAPLVYPAVWEDTLYYQTGTFSDGLLSEGENLELVTFSLTERTELQRIPLRCFYSTFIPSDLFVLTKEQWYSGIKLESREGLAIQQFTPHGLELLHSLASIDETSDIFPGNYCFVSSDVLYFSGGSNTFCCYDYTANTLWTTAERTMEEFSVAVTSDGIISMGSSSRILYRYGK